MATADYDWHPDAKEGGSVFKVETRNLGWWIFLAILVSILIHIVLYFVLSRWEQTKKSDDAINFRMVPDQGEIDRSRLEELLAQNESKIPDNLDVQTPENRADLDVNQDFDEFEVMDMIQEELIKMAPVDSPQFSAPALPQVPVEALDSAAKNLDLSSSQAVNDELKTMRKKLLESSNQVAAEQMVIEIETQDLGKGIDTDKFLRDAANKAMGQEADEFVKGYASLDELLRMTGGFKKGSVTTAILPSDILFGYNETELKGEAKMAMIKLAYLIETNQDAIFIIEGHTDGFGGDEYNRRLSLQRAESVRDWLVKQLRLSTSNIRVVGKGKSDPLVPLTGDADEQALNRRVEIEIRKP